VTDELVADPSGHRLYAVVLRSERGLEFDNNTRIAAFDNPASPAVGQAVLTPHKRAEFRGRVHRLRVSPDGRKDPLRPTQ
jgi:hypothetical protein